MDKNNTLYTWDSKKGDNVRLFCDPGFTYSLATDEVVHAIDEPMSGCDRRRESLRLNKNGTYYLHTDNDREDEVITTSGWEIDNWIDKQGIVVD